MATAAAGAPTVGAVAASLAAEVNTRSHMIGAQASSIETATSTVGTHS